ncbi:MAG TPA: penicillin acylase family protein, partial [Acidobacteriota bacterium]|nr:penicillin acylase family protein [Acidobacteriota bacterium]
MTGIDRRVLALPLLFSLLFASCERSTPELPGGGVDAGETIVYRDAWGVPHIYAPTWEEGIYAMGWAQAQDRPDQLLMNFLLGMGQGASVMGADALRFDLWALQWRLYEGSRENFDRVRPEVRRHLRAFVRGIRDYFAAHPDDLPDWWGDREIDEFMPVAFGRLFLYGWSFGQALGDLRRGGIEPDLPDRPRGSNQWAVSPARSAAGAAILLIDPHLSWLGPERFWEFRMHAGPVTGSGFTLPGIPYIGLGHNADVAWAMTTGGPDTADVYSLELRDGEASSYLYDGSWRDLVSRQIDLDVRGQESLTVTLLESHLGPILAVRDGKAYAARSAYADAYNPIDAWYLFNQARTYQDIADALAELTLFPQNVMVADTSGNIYYQRTGRVPRRPSGFDWTRPVDGTDSRSDWQGFHGAGDLIQILNPEAGYMQNCNIPPDAMIPGGPVDPNRMPAYLFDGDARSGQVGGWTNQRGARAVELLSSNDTVTVEDALDYALDLRPFGAERWLQVLKEAGAAYGESEAADPDWRRALDDLLSWDGRLEPSSTPALQYFYWRRQLNQDLGQDAAADLRRKVDRYYEIVIQGRESAPQLAPTEQAAMVRALSAAVQRLKADFGNLNGRFGDRFRVGRGEESWPLGGGGGENLGITTLRNIGYGPEREDGTQWGVRGQTSTQVVVLTRPIQSWTVTPLGQSDRPDSLHYVDQARDLF